MSYEQDFIDNCTPRAQCLLGLDKTDPIAFSNEYFQTKHLGSLSIDPNANVGGISPNNFLAEIAKPFTKQIFYRRLYEKGIKRYGSSFSLKSVYNGYVYIHNATKLQPYCFGVSATEIATEGRPYSRLPALPPKRLESFMGQLAEFIMDCSQEFAGAVAITDLVPWIAYFVELGKIVITKDINGIFHENVPYADKDIENIFQSFVHILNNNFRVGGDSPFTNISVNSKIVYDDIFSNYYFPDGKSIATLWRTIERIQKIIIDFMAKGQPNGLPYRFPILTANFKAKEEEMHTEWFTYVAKKNAKGFMNINFAEKFAMCCRLSLDFDFKQNSFGGGGVKVGSMCVTNINLPRIALDSMFLESTRDKSKRIETFLTIVKEYIDDAMKYLTCYKDVFQDLIDCGYLKFFREPSNWFTIDMFFATVGFCGIYDAAEIILNEKDIKDFYAQLGAQYGNVLEARTIFMEKVIDIFVMKTKEKSNGIKFNVEEVPSESAAGFMAKFNQDFGETKQYYSNQFVPLDGQFSLPLRINTEAKLQSKLTGGGMTFLNFDAPLSEEQSLHIHKLLMNKGFTGQFCINYGYTKCLSCEKVTPTMLKRCECGSDQVVNYTRVVGYFAEVFHMNKAKQAEVTQRKAYSNAEA